MPYPHSEAIHWYYRIFMPDMQKSKLMPNKPEDWARLQVWDGNSLKPALPEGFSGVPTEAQIEQLYAHVKSRELFFFELGQLAGTGHCCAVYHEGRQDFSEAVLSGV